MGRPGFAVRHPGQQIATDTAQVVHAATSVLRCSLAQQFYCRRPDACRRLLLATRLGTLAAASLRIARRVCPRVRVFDNGGRSVAICCHTTIERWSRRHIRSLMNRLDHGCSYLSRGQTSTYRGSYASNISRRPGGYLDCRHVAAAGTLLLLEHFRFFSACPTTRTALLATATATFT